MIDVTDYYIGDKVRVLCEDGEEFEGEIEALEFEDDIEKGEDFIILETKSGGITFYATDLADIKLIA